MRHRGILLLSCVSALLLLLALLVPAAQAQVVETDPTFPSADEPLTIYLNTEGTELEDYTGTVYAHTGVNTAEGNWQCVIESWGTNDTQPALTREGSERYSLHIDDVAAFYDLSNCPDVSGAGEVTGLAFVFRNAAGNAQTRPDIHIDVSPAPLNVAFVQPATSGRDPLIAEHDTTVEVVAVAAAREEPLERVRLLVDGTEVSGTADDTLRYDLRLEAPGRVDVWAIAEAGGRADTASFYAVRNPEVTTAPRPDGLQDGITYAEDGTAATLSLYAPGKDYVYVIGDFTDWAVDPSTFMQRDGDYFWLTIDGLTPGKEYGFQYFVDGQIRVTDPYVEKVLTPNDGFISEEVYPDLKPYPRRLTDHIVGVLQPGYDEYEWQVTDFEAPPQDELVIYELLLRDFLAAHDYETLVDTLDYLDRLGVNAIELMPVAEFDGNESWGYNPSFHFALDKYYGTEEAFKGFVDAAHARGIAVILDVVYNHATGQSPLIRLWNESAMGDPSAIPTPDNPYANVTAPHFYSVFNDLNHESAITQYWLDRANRFWLEEYQIDGYRFDLTKGFMQSGSTDGYNEGRIDLLTRMVDEIREVEPDAYVIFEHLGQNDEEIVYAHYRTDEGLPGIMLWGNMNHPYSEAAMGYHDGGKSDLEWAYFGERGWTEPNLVTYMESHDEQWLMFKNLSYGNSSGDYDVQELPVALDRMKMAGAFFYSFPGPKMMWQFGELGYGGGPNECLVRGDYPGECSDDVPGRVSPKPIRWEEYWTDSEGEDALRRKLYGAWSALIHLRQAHDVFTHEDTDVEMETRGIIKRITLAHPFNGEEAVIVGNFGVTQREFTVTFPSDGTWYDFYENGSLEVTDASRAMTLAPGEFHIFLNTEPAVSPEAGLITVDAEDVADVPHVFSLEQNYPNPFNPSTTIVYTLERPGHTRLDIFDVLGRRVATPVDGAQPAGRHTVTFEAGDLPSGLYFYRLEAGDHSATRRMLLIK